MKLLRFKGSTSKIIRFFVASQSTGLGVPSLTYTSFTIYYHRGGDATATSVTLVAGSAVGTYTNSGGAGTGGGVLAVDSTNMPGLYEFSCPDAMWAAGDPILNVTCPMGDFCPPMEFELTGVDVQAAQGASNALIAFGTGTGQLDVTAGNLAGAVPSVTAPVSLGSTGLDAVKGWGSWSARQTLQAVAQFLLGLRTGVPASGSGGTVTYTGPSAVAYGTITVDTSGNITANAMTPPA